MGLLLQPLPLNWCHWKGTVSLLFKHFSSAHKHTEVYTYTQTHTLNTDSHDLSCFLCLCQCLFICHVSTSLTGQTELTGTFYRSLFFFFLPLPSRTGLSTLKSFISITVAVEIYWKEMIHILQSQVYSDYKYSCIFPFASKGKWQSMSLSVM